MLEDLRTRLDAGGIEGPPPDQRDRVGMALARIVGVGEFEERLRSLKEDQESPWAEMPETNKVKVLVDVANVAEVHGEYALAAIEKEVNYQELSPWRREALEGLRSRVDQGEFDGGHSGPSYLANGLGYALDLTELKSLIEDSKRLGALDGHGERWPWGELSEEQKLADIEIDIANLGLQEVAEAYAMVESAVDLARVPEERRRAFEISRDAAEPAEENLGGSYLIVPHRSDGHFSDPLDEPCSVEDGEFFRLVSYLRDHQTRFLAGLGDFPTLAAAQDFAKHNTAGLSEGVVIEGHAYLELQANVERGILRSRHELADDFDDMPSPEEWRKLKAEWTHDYGLRRMEERGVRYEDQTARQLDDSGHRSNGDIIGAARTHGQNESAPDFDVERRGERER
jgi:hypothetical protein